MTQLHTMIIPYPDKHPQQTGVIRTTVLIISTELARKLVYAKGKKNVKTLQK